MKKYLFKQAGKLVLIPALSLHTFNVTAQQPNIIVVITDDAGYADWGFQGSNVCETPYIDQLKSYWTEYGTNGAYDPVAYDGVKGVGHPSVPRGYRSLGLLDGTFASLADVPSIPSSEDAPGYTGWYYTSNDEPFRYVHDEDRDLLEDEKSANWVVSKLEELEQPGG